MTCSHWRRQPATMGGTSSARLSGSLADRTVVAQQRSPVLAAIEQLDDVMSSERKRCMR